MTSLIMPEPPASVDPTVKLNSVQVTYSELFNRVYLGYHELDYDNVQLLMKFLTGVFPRMKAGRIEELRTTPPYDYTQLELDF